MRDRVLKHSLATIRVPEVEQMVADRKKKRVLLHYRYTVNVHAWDKMTQRLKKYIVSNNSIKTIQQCLCVWKGS